MPGQVAGAFDDGHLHAEADAEEGDVALAGETHGFDFADGAALAEAAGDEDAVHAVKLLHGVGLLEDFGIDPVELDFDVVGDAAMGEGLGQGFIAVEQIGVFADDGDAHDRLPVGGAISTMRCQCVRSGSCSKGRLEMAQHFTVHAGLVVGDGHGVDGVDVERRDDGFGADIAEAGDFAALILRDRAVAAADEHVRLDADVLQLFDASAGSAWFSARRPRGCRAPA